MLHSASRNLRHEVRIITNPPVSLNQPFNYDGKNPSLVEQKTLRDLGHPEGLPNWKITSPRERVIPDRVDVSCYTVLSDVAKLTAAIGSEGDEA
jgi:hypothetical protein